MHKPPLASRLFATLLLGLISFLAHSAQGEHKSFLWRASKGDALVYLLGSVHVADRDFYPLSPAIETAWRESDTLALEVIPGVFMQQTVNKAMRERGLYPDGETIADHLLPDTVKRLRGYFEGTRLPFARVARLRPVPLAMTLLSAHLRKLGYVAEYGIDVYLSNRAIRQGRPMLELESAEQQIDLLFNISPAEEYLRYTLKEIDQTGAMFREIKRAWLKGDAQAMYELILRPYEDDPDSRGLMKAMFDDRNTAMTSKILSWMKTHKRLLVVVGAGHLLGDKGIIALLKQSGLRIEQR